MRVVRGFETVDGSLRPCVLTVGNFDGVHRGHQALLRTLVATARVRGVPALAITFDPHPAKVLAPDRAPPLLLPVDRRLELLAGMGIHGTLIQPFDEAFSRLKAEEFVDRVLVQALRARAVVLGPGFRYGAGGVGTVESLEAAGAVAGFDVVRIEPVLDDGAPISSSRVRALVASGYVEDAARLLGRPPELIGRVVPGNGRGRQIGVPTANLDVETEVLPRDGVYAGRVDIEEGAFRAVVNLGVRPTFAAGRSVEVHLLDFDGSLYDRRLGVKVDRRLRDERKFESVDALVAQIEDDIERARRG